VCAYKCSYNKLFINTESFKYKIIVYFTFVTKKFFIILIFFILIFNSSFKSQQFYYGFGYTFNVLSPVKLGYQYLSESPYFNHPYKIDKKIQLNSNFDLRAEVTIGIQRKLNFFELNLSPFYNKSFQIKAQEANFGKTIKIKELNYQFSASDLAFRYKQVISGRKRVRTTVLVGASGMFLYNKKTNIDEKEIHFNLFEFERKLYTILQFGIEAILFNGSENVMIGLYYEHQLSKFTSEITNGYLYFGFRYLIYKKKIKRTVYLND
jgi:hypothetical protein